MGKLGIPMVDLEYEWWMTNTIAKLGILLVKSEYKGR